MVEVTGTKTFYHATPTSLWESKVSKEGLTPQPLDLWIPGDTRRGVFLGASEKTIVDFVERGSYVFLEMMEPSSEGERKFLKSLEYSESYALLEVEIPESTKMFPGEVYTIEGKDYGAYVITEPVPRENVKFIGTIVISEEKALEWLKRLKGEQGGDSYHQVELTQVYPEEPNVHSITYRGGPFVGTLQTMDLNSSLVVTKLIVGKPRIVSREFLIALGEAVESMARRRGLKSIMIKYLPKHKSMYLAAGFEQSYAEGESDMVVRRVLRFPST